MEGTILLIDGGIAHKDLSINASLKITSAGMIEEFKKQEVNRIKSEISDEIRERVISQLN